MAIGDPQSWRTIQKSNFFKIEDLLDFLELDSSNRQQVLYTSKFPLNLPKRIAKKCTKNDLNDPLVKQFLPLIQETSKKPGYICDPVGDTSAKKTQKLLHKYHGRVLILASSACAMHCRYCFRQNFPYEVDRKNFAEELDYIRSDPSIFEVILSGGDPLSLSDETLSNFIQELGTIKHIKLLRFHSRFPIGIPERISDSFLALLKSSHLQITFILHVNHIRELDTDIIQAMKSLQRLGIPVLTHTVLLLGINDNVETLRDLFQELITYGIIPYYLNQFDRVQGGSHFDLDIAKGKAIHKELLKWLPGYAVPKYVQEIAGQLHKVPIF